jgi:ketosteroid isomerase-like protein
LKNVAPYVRDEAEPVVRPATDARTDAWWPVSRFRANVLYRAQGERSTRRRTTMNRMVVAAAEDDVHELIEQYFRAQGEFLRGNPEAVKDLFSHRDDVTLANPYGPPVRGFDEVSKTIDHAASLRSDGTFLGWQIVAKYVSDDLAYVVQIEWAEAKIGAREEITPLAVRATMIFRPEEDGEWKIVHRHSDPITTAQPAESVIQE